MRRSTLLLVEDSKEVLEDNRKALVAAGYEVLAASTLAGARERLARRQPDLILLDVLLPDGNGVELCRELRDSTAAPILFLTSLGESEQIVEGLRAGRDDYVTKPYRMEELLARVEAQLRRTERIRGEAAEGVGGLTLDARAQRAFLEGKDLLLKPKEFQLLCVLLRSRDRFRTAEELYQEVWGLDANADARTVLVHISNLRAKLRGGREEGNIQIQREGSRGYRLTLEAEKEWE